MRISTIRGIIDRRILVNYRIDVEALAKVLPAPFRPKIFHGYGVGGICLIRIKNARPQFVPFDWGLNSENAAHRIAVEWDSDAWNPEEQENRGQTQQGVYIPRRDTNSRLNVLIGGNLFPGIHHHAKFSVEETEDYFFG